MKSRYLMSALMALGVAAFLPFASTTVVGQKAEPVKGAPVKMVSAAPNVPLYNPHLPKPSGPAPRHADGHPDLNGMWDFRSGTPMSRPASLGDRLFFTKEEGDKFEAEQNKRVDTDIRSSDPHIDGLLQGNNNAWFDYGGPLMQHRTSLIVDPPNGRQPAMTPKGRAFKVPGVGVVGPERSPDKATDRSLQERCLANGGGPPFGGRPYNNNVRLVHGKDAVVIETEMIHTARVVWLDGRPHLGGGIRQWHGDSRGHWEGDTLVVETTNFRPEAVEWLRIASPVERYKFVERFTRIDADTVMYEYTMNDPETWTAPWTVQMPLKKLDGYMYEYACHEANYGLKYQLLAGRAMDKKEAEEKAKGNTPK